MISVFDDWSERCSTILRYCERRVAELRKDAIERRRLAVEHEKVFDRAVEKSSGDDRGMKVGFKRGVGEEDGGLGYADDPEVMDVDETFGRGGQRNAKRGGRFGGVGRKVM